MSVGKHHIPDDALSTKHIDQSIEILLKKVTINRDYWIPYLAGYSKEWVNSPTVFIDYRVPDTMKIGKKDMRITRYLLIHECVEKCLMHDLGLPYELAHNLATAAEKTAVEADGFSWALYTEHLRPLIKMVTSKPKDKDSPKQLDKAPYEQENAPFLDTMTR